MNQQKQNGNIIAIITMFFLFAMISFVTNLAAPFGTIWKNQYAGANTLGMMGNMMNFLAYLFMGIPSGNMLVKIGYKKTALIAMAVGFIGLFIQYISSLFGADIDVFNLGEYAIKMNFIIYLLGAFVCGFCVCMLNTVVNPMLNLLGGGGNKGTSTTAVTPELRTAKRSPTRPLIYTSPSVAPYSRVFPAMVFFSASKLLRTGGSTAMRPPLSPFPR